MIIKQVKQHSSGAMVITIPKKSDIEPGDYISIKKVSVREENSDE